MAITQNTDIYQSNRITTNLFEKQLNIYLYIPPHLAHPPRFINGIIYGQIHRITALCCGWWRQADGGRYPWMGEIGANRYLIAQAEDGKGGATGRGKADTGLREELLGLTSRGGKRRRAVEANRRGRRPGGRLLRSQARWEGRSGFK